ncbi:GntR family transcriptional regulator [Brassicibacter mesophilus]|uniref:GntR family transcriptional regulator n=1 Tax=Brassicibacter mesophilus TaxID=745119 RepID=UPI003D1B0E66
MVNSMIDSMVPKYFVLKEEIIKMIDNEEIKSDELIPSERELMEQYGLSRTTVRKAIDVLVNEGYLYKVQGKGTYVKGKKFTQGLINLTSCTEELKRHGFKPEAKLIHAGIEKVNKKIQKYFNLESNEKVFFTERVFYGDGYPINTTKSYIPYKLVPGIEKYDFSKNSLYKVLEEQYNIKVLRANRTIEAVLAYDEIAKLLEIDESKPILFFRGWVYGLVNGEETIVEFFKTHYRSDRSKFYIEQIRG